MDTEDELETGDRTEIILRFLVSDLTLEEQNNFVGRMSRFGFGLPTEGRFSQLWPPQLAGTLGETATFIFTAIRAPQETLNEAVKHEVAAALFVARTSKALPLSASSDVVNEVSLPSGEAAA